MKIIEKTSERNAKWTEQKTRNERQSERNWECVWLQGGVKLFDFVDPAFSNQLRLKINLRKNKKEPVHFSGEYLARTALVPVLD
jgi:hypothetical protein